MFISIPCYFHTIYMCVQCALENTRIDKDRKRKRKEHVRSEYRYTHCFVRNLIPQWTLCFLRGTPHYCFEDKSAA